MDIHVLKSLESGASLAWAKTVLVQRFRLLVVLILAFLSGATSTSAQTIEFDFSPGGGYVGIVGQNPQKLNFPIKFSDMGITSARFVQSDADGDGLFNIQGNDIPGSLVLVNESAQTFTIDGAVVWRNNELTGVGFIYRCATVGASLLAPTISIPYSNATVPYNTQTAHGNSSTLNLICNEGNSSDSYRATNIFFGINTTSIYDLYGYSDISENAAQLDSVLTLLNNAYLASIGAPSIEGWKLSSITTDTGAVGLSAGDTLTYTVSVKNTGNVTVTGAGVQSDTLRQADETPSANALSVFALSGGSTTLAPGATASFTATYVVGQADIDAGGLSNTATVEAVYGGTAYTDVTHNAADADGTVTNLGSPTTNLVAPSPSIEGVKTVSVTTDTGVSGLSVGDTLTYTIAMTNTGNVTLTGVDVQSDTLSRGTGNSLTAVSSFTDANFTTNGSTTLAPGASVSYTGTYLVTQADIDDGGLSNTATVVGTPPSGPVVTNVTDNGNDTDGNTSNDATALIVVAAPSISLTKSVNTSFVVEGKTRISSGFIVDMDGDGVASTGDRVYYDFVVANTGNVMVRNVGLTDVSADVVSTSLISSLAPSASDSATFEAGAHIVLTQADLDAGSVSNSAVATGDSPSATDDVSDTSGSAGNNDTVTVLSLGQMPSLQGIKTVELTNDADSSGGISVGDELTYTITATNTGNVTLTSVGVSSDTLSRGTTSLTEITEFSAADFELAANDSTALLPEATAAFTATYVVTQADVDAGGLSNTATVIGTTPTFTIITDLTDNGVTGAGDTGLDPTRSSLQPFARDDRSFGHEIGSSVSVSVLTNDSYAGASSPIVILVDQHGNATSQLSVDGEGVWSVVANNIVRFTPDAAFVGDPTPVGYKIRSSNVPNSMAALIYIDYLGLKAPDELVAADDELVGQDPSEPVTVSPLVNDADGNVGELVPATLRLLDANNNPVTELVVAGEGTWTVNVNARTVTFTPAQDFTGSNVSVKYYVENTAGLPQTASIKILFIDPGGVVYDSETLAPTAGVTLQFADADGTPLPESCLAEGQQPQTTSADGRYRFDLSVECTDLNGKEFQILITDTPGYQLEPALEGKQAGPLDPRTPASGTFEVVYYDTAPLPSQPREYYMSFIIGANSQQIVNNHIPISSLVSLIEDDLREVLRDDLAATMTQQSRQMAGYGASALQRLNDESSSSCAAQINPVLQDAPIRFDTGSAVILEASNPTLDRVARLLSDCEISTFEVGGHTDNVADEAYNLNLSLMRASAVVAALRQRGVAHDVLSAVGYGETMPVADNSFEEGRQLNRRVEFRATGRLAGNDHCVPTASSGRGLDATIDQNGANIEGDFRQETRDCDRDGWNILEGSVSYLTTDRGMSQGMANLSYRTERFRTQNHLAGRFVGIYATTNDVTGLATGTIQGFGLSAGLYGARRYDSGLYLDYYLGAATGRHNFNLGFSRSAGVVMADGHYTYVAAFAGTAVSGEIMLGDYRLSPRAGFEGAWSPGGNAEYEASRGSIEQLGVLSTGEIAGLRIFGELSFNDVLLNRPEELAITPILFCDRPMGEDRNECGLGLSMALSHEDEDTGTSYGIELIGERTKIRETIGLQLSYTQPLFGGELSGTSSVGRDGQMAVGANYVLDF
jgi:uncharacterized repeat protein (TIGR01451 family)